MALIGDSMTTQLSKSTQEKFVIGEGKTSRTFLSDGWSPLLAAKNLPKIGKTFATPISFLFSATEENFGTLIPQALYLLFEEMEQGDIEALFNLILSKVWADNGTRLVDLDNDFANLDELLSLVALVLKQHYGCLTSGKAFASLLETLVPVSRMTQA
jgi:hypothetical protein